MKERLSWLLFFVFTPNFFRFTRTFFVFTPNIARAVRWFLYLHGIRNDISFSMQRLYFLIVWFLVAHSAGAQRPALHKMSSFVREAYYATQSAGSGMTTRATTRRPATLPAFVKLCGSDKSVLERNRCKVLAQYGSLFAAEIPLENLSALSRDSHVLRIESGRRSTTQMDTVCHIVRTPQVYQGLDLPRGYSGKGVVVGVQDIGFDLTHPNFYSQDMTTYRIKAMWDQLATDTVGSRLPVGRDYTGQDALLALGHPRDGFIQTHGTHTAGTAAGSGAQAPGILTPYRGVAYDSDLCLVCNITTDDGALLDPNDFYKYTYVLDVLGFKYIFDYAAGVGKPCVINFSQGSYEDFRGEDQLYYEMLDSLCGPGRIIVAAAGNRGHRYTHVRKSAGKPFAGLFWNSETPMTMVSTKSDGNFTMQIRCYKDPTSPLLKEIDLSTVLAAPDSVYTDSIVAGPYVYRITATAYPSSYNAAETVCDWMMSVNAPAMNKAFQTSVCLAGTHSAVDMYLHTGYYFHNTLDPTLNAGDNAYSILSPGSAPGVICVGSTAYRTQFVNYLGERKVYDSGINGVRAVFSSVGPTVDGRTKPDVMAPGQNIISSHSSFFVSNPDTPSEHLASDILHFDYNGRTYSWSSNAGTSMSAPIVTGVIALWLEADPTLTMHDCLDIFAKTCRRHDPALTYPNNLYGYGEIDAHEGMKMVLERVTAGISNVSASPLHVNRIYAVDGRYVGNDASRLPRGIYIRGGRKFVVSR